jgi:hypothetical protein
MLHLHAISAFNYNDSMLQRAIHALLFNEPGTVAAGRGGVWAAGRSRAAGRSEKGSSRGWVVWLRQLQKDNAWVACEKANAMIDSRI